MHVVLRSDPSLQVLHLVQTCVERRRWKQYSLHRTAKITAIGFCFTVGNFIIFMPCMIVLNFQGSSFKNVVSDFGQVSRSIYNLGSSSEESVSGLSGFCPSSYWFTVIVVGILSEFEHSTRQGETQRGRCYLQ